MRGEWKRGDEYQDLDDLDEGISWTGREYHPCKKHVNISIRCLASRSRSLVPFDVPMHDRPDKKWLCTSPAPHLTLIVAHRDDLIRASSGSLRAVTNYGLARSTRVMPLSSRSHLGRREQCNADLYGRARTVISHTRLDKPDFGGGCSGGGVSSVSERFYSR